MAGAAQTALVYGDRILRNRSGRHMQVRAGKAYMQPMKIFSQPSVNGPSETEDILHNPAGMFHFAAYRGFAVFNRPLSGREYERFHCSHDYRGDRVTMLKHRLLTRKTKQSVFCSEPVTAPFGYEVYRQDDVAKVNVPEGCFVEPGKVFSE